MARCRKVGREQNDRYMFLYINVIWVKTPLQDNTRLQTNKTRRKASEITHACRERWFVECLQDVCPYGAKQFRRGFHLFSTSSVHIGPEDTRLVFPLVGDRPSGVKRQRSTSLPQFLSQGPKALICVYTNRRASSVFRSGLERGHDCRRRLLRSFDKEQQRGERFHAGAERTIWPK